MITIVKYRNKAYEVISNNYLGDNTMYKLASHFAGGSAFGVKKDACKIIMKKPSK